MIKLLTSHWDKKFFFIPSLLFSSLLFSFLPYSLLLLSISIYWSCIILDSLPINLLRQHYKKHLAAKDVKSKTEQEKLSIFGSVGNGRGKSKWGTKWTISCSIDVLWSGDCRLCVSNCTVLRLSSTFHVSCILAQLPTTTTTTTYT